MASLAPASSEFVEVLRRGLEAYDAGEMGRASQLFDEALEIEPDNVWGLLWKGATSPTVGESKMWLEQAIAIDPHNEHARAGLRWANERLSSGAEDTDAFVGLGVATPTYADDTFAVTDDSTDEATSDLDDWLMGDAPATTEEGQEFSSWLEDLGTDTQDAPATDSADAGLSFADPYTTTADESLDDLSDEVTSRELDDLFAMDVTDPTDTLFDVPIDVVDEEEDTETVPLPSTGELPDWLSRDADTAEDDGMSDVVTGTTEETSEGLDWLTSDEPTTTTTTDASLPDWLTADMGADLEEAADAGQAVPTWLNENTDSELDVDLSQAAELPDWLNDDSPVATQETTLPDWLTGDDSSSDATATAEAEDLPNWLTRNDDEMPQDEVTEPSSNGTAAVADLPDWLLGDTDTGTATTTDEADLPDWLTGGSDTAATDEAELPDWLTGGGESTTATQEDEGLPDWLTGASDERSDTSTVGELPAWLLGEDDGSYQPSRSKGSIAASNEVAEAYQTGLWAYEEDRLEDATVAFQRVIRLDSTHVEAHNYLGSVFYLNGRPDDAIAALRRALELDPNHSESYLNLGLVYKETARNAQASQMFRRYLDLAPEDDSTRQYVQEMIDQLG